MSFSLFPQYRSCMYFSQNDFFIFSANVYRTMLFLLLIVSWIFPTPATSKLQYRATVANLFRMLPNDLENVSTTTMQILTYGVLETGWCLIWLWANDFFKHVDLFDKNCGKIIAQSQIFVLSSTCFKLCVIAWSFNKLKCSLIYVSEWIHLIHLI